MISYRALLSLFLILVSTQLYAVPQKPDTSDANLIVKLDFKGGSANTGLKFSADGKQLWTNRIEAWNVPSGDLVVESPLAKQKRYPYVFDVSSAQSLVLIGRRASNEVKVWGVDGNPIERKIKPEGKVIDTKIFDGGKRFAVLLSEPASIYTGTLESEVNDETWNLPFEVYRGTFSDNANILAVRIGKGVRVLDVAQKKTIADLLQENSIMSFRLSPDARFVATGSRDNAVRVFDISEQKMIAKMMGHGQGGIFLPVAIYSLAFSPDGRWLASGGHDGKVIIWDLKTYEPAFALQIDGPPIVQSITFSPDSKRVAASFENAGAKHGIRVWELPDDAR